MRILSCGERLLMPNTKPLPLICSVVVIEMVPPFEKGCYGQLKQQKCGLGGTLVMA
jgi:hypothetical protein